MPHNALQCRSLPINAYRCTASVTMCPVRRGGDHEGRPQRNATQTLMINAGHCGVIVGTLRDDAGRCGATRGSERRAGITPRSVGRLPCTVVCPQCRAIPIASEQRHAHSSGTAAPRPGGTRYRLHTALHSPLPRLPVIFLNDTLITSGTAAPRPGGTRYRLHTAPTLQRFALCAPPLPAYPLFSGLTTDHSGA